MFGDNLLVAPVFHASKATYYLPSGTWTCLWSNTKHVGPKWVTEDTYPFDLIPVFVRQNSVLLLGPKTVAKADYEYSKVELECRGYDVEEEVEVRVPTGKGGEWAGSLRVGPGGEVKGNSGKFKVVKGKHGGVWV